MSISDKLLDLLTGYDVDLVRVEAYLQKGITKDIKALEKSLIALLKGNELDYTDSQRLRKALGQQLINDAKTEIVIAYGQINETHQISLTDVAKLGEKQIIEALNKVLKVDLITTTISAQSLSSIAKNTLIMGAPSKAWWLRQSKGLQNQFTDLIRQSMVQGLTTPQIVQLVRGSKAAGYKDGIMSAKYRNAEALVRSSVQTVANAGRLKAYQANDDIVKGIEWVSTLDNRTSTTCMALDGKQWTVHLKPIGHNKVFPGATAHWNCRSSQISVLKSWDELGAKRRFSEVPESTRASMDGQVSAKKNYEDWLKGKPESFQKEVLGEGKWNLWKNGKLGFTDLVDQSGNPLPLSALVN